MGLTGKQLGIYRVGAELGRGGMGAVYRGESTADGPAGPAGATVALKVFHSELVADERAFARFRLEAEIGKEVHHEHLVRTYGMGRAEVDGEVRHFMVMELIEGRTLKGLLEDLGTLPGPLLFQVSDQILGALDAIHSRGVVHRDVKPENIVITPDHRVLLMDLGVARREGGSENTKSGEFVGSLAYAPPEQFAGTEVGPRSDIYAFGVMLYELATGRNPFVDDDVSNLMRRKVEEELPPPRTVATELDAFWDGVIFTCVRREATARFASAGELRRILAEGERSEWWRRQAAGHADTSGAAALKRLRVERRARRVGREKEMEAVRKAGARAREGGGALLVRGPGGAGKTRLVHDYLEEVAGAGGPALAAGRALGAGGAAYGPFRQALGDLLGDADDQAARVPELLADTPGVVAPFAAFLRGELQPGPDSGLSKDALLGAVVRVLQALAARRPLVLALDDLHLAGAETVELLGHVARGAAGRPLFVLGTFADDELADDSPLAALAAGDAVETLAVGNLPAAATEELVRAVVRHDKTVRGAAPVLHEKSEGNPLIVLEVLAHMEADGVLAADEEGLALVGDLAEVALPTTLRDLVGLKLKALDEEQRETLEAASVLGVEFDAGLLAAVVDEKPIVVSQRLAGLERRHRILQSAGQNAFRFAGRQLYEAIYEGIPDGLRAEYHDLVAETLLEEDDAPTGERAYDTLRHLYLAERGAEAAPFLEGALDHMAANFHASYAAPFLEKVADVFAEAPAAARLALAMRLWAFYEVLGSREDQMRVLEGAAALAGELGDTEARARVHALRAGSYWYAGDFDAAGKEAEAGLALAREAGSRKWESTCHHTLGVVDYRRGDLEACARRWREALAIRREIGDRRGEASTLQALAIIQPAVGEGDRALATMQESLAAWRECGERRGEALMLMNIGNHFIDTARYDEGLRHLEQAIESHHTAGDVLSEALALTNLGRAQHILGRIDDARASLERALANFRDIGYPNGELAARSILGSALGAYGEYDDARAHLEGAIELARQTGIKAQLVQATRELGEVLYLSGHRDEGWRRLDEALALEDELGDAESRVLTLGLAAKVALDEGDTDKATRLLESALDDARAGEGTDAPLVLCRLARAHRGEDRGDEAAACAREAREWIGKAGAVSTLEGPEIYYTLYLVEGDADSLRRARELVDERARPIRHDAFREHFLTRVWPNSVIRAMTDG